MIDPLELHAYADGELDRQSEERVRKQLQEDSASQAELDCIKNLKACLQANCEPVACADTWKACVGRLNELDKVKKTESFVGKYAWALCGIFFLFILGGGIMSRMGGGRGMGSPDLARAVASLGPVSRPSSNEPEQKRQWVDSMIGQASQIISPDTLNVVGAATGEIDGNRVAQLALRDGAGDLTMLVVNAPLDLSSMPASSDAKFKIGKLQGVNCVAWSDGGLTLVIAANRSYDDLVETAGVVSVKH